MSFELFPKNCAIMVGAYVLWECIPCSRSSMRKGKAPVEGVGDEAGAW